MINEDESVWCPIIHFTFISNALSIVKTVENDATITEHHIQISKGTLSGFEKAAMAIEKVKGYIVGGWWSILLSLLFYIHDAESIQRVPRHRPPFDQRPLYCFDWFLPSIEDQNIWILSLSGFRSDDSRK